MSADQPTGHDAESFRMQRRYTPGEEAARTLAAYVADVIDHAQGWTDDPPHADLEALGAAVHTILGRTQPRTQAALDL